MDDKLAVVLWELVDRRRSFVLEDLRKRIANLRSRWVGVKDLVMWYASVSTGFYMVVDSNIEKVGDVRQLLGAGIPERFEFVGDRMRIWFKVPDTGEFYVDLVQTDSSELSGGWLAERLLAELEALGL